MPANFATSTATIRLLQQPVFAGDPRRNTNNLIASIQQAERDGVQLLVGSEMMLPGYMIGDRWLNDALVRDIQGQNERVRKATPSSLTTVTGSLVADFGKINFDGTTRKYNAALVANNGKWLSNEAFPGYTIKTLLPNYDMFEDPRYFHSLFFLSAELGISLDELIQPFPISMDGETLMAGVILCEDMWSDDYSHLPRHPIQILKNNGAEILINLSCSPYKRFKLDKRIRVARDRVREVDLPMIYVNNTHPQNIGKNIFAFDGQSFVMNANGDLIFLAPAFQSGHYDLALGQLFDSAKTYSISVKKDFSTEMKRAIDARLSMIRYQWRKGMSDEKIRLAMIGLSGGKDSTLSFILLCLALGAEHLDLDDGFLGQSDAKKLKEIALAGAQYVFGVNMPSKHNKEETKSFAENLARNFGSYYLTYSIQNSVDLTEAELEQAIFDRILNDSSLEHVDIVVNALMHENIQARDRSSRVLSALSAAVRAFYTNNGNKNEVARGYATIYGDINGAIMPLAGLAKDDARAEKITIQSMLEFFGDIFSDLMPKGVITQKASAELSDEQADDGDPFDYQIDGPILELLVDRRFDPEDVLQEYMDGTLDRTLGLKDKSIHDFFPTDLEFVQYLRKFWQDLHNSYFKRVQSPPNLSDDRVSFGFALRETQEAAYFTDRYLELEKELLEKF